jgi:TolB-like protein
MRSLLPVLALASSLALASAGARAAGPDERIRVAVLPVVVHSLEDGQYLQAGLEDMLVSRLGRSPQIAVVLPQEAEPATTDVQAALARGRALGAQYVVFGSFTRFGDGASLDLQCLAASGEGEPPRQLFVQSGSLGQIIPMLDDLSDKITHYVIEGPPTKETAAVSAAAASDGDAHDATSSALADLRRRVEALEEAVQSRVGEAPAQVGQGELPADRDASPLR